MNDAQITAAREAGASDADVSLIQQLRDRAQEFSLAQQNLQRLGAEVAKTNDYALLMDYGDLVRRADGIRAKISAATSALDSAIAWARGTFGLQGMQQLSALGAWFLPAAAILAASAVIGYWLNDYLKFTKRFAEQRRIAAELTASGLPPAEAQQQASRAVAAAVPSAFAGVSSALTWGALLVVGFLMFKKYAQ